jgi:hypothetical protein
MGLTGLSPVRFMFTPVYKPVFRVMIDVMKPLSNKTFYLFYTPKAPNLAELVNFITIPLSLPL